MSNICHSLDHVVDELHLMLHVTDILIGNLVNECLDWDREVALDQKGGSKQYTSQKPNSGDQVLQRFFWCVGTKKCWWKSQWQIWLDEPLRIWQEDPIGWPPQQSAQYPPPRKCINCHWDMDSICWHKVVNSWNPEKEPKEFFSNAKEWISLFLRINSKREGYERHQITPYMHIMVAHINRFFELPKSDKIFTGQGVEKNNEMAHGIILQKSNKWGRTSAREKSMPA